MRTLFVVLLSFQLLFAISLTKEEKDFIKAHPVIKVSNEKAWPPFDFNENGKPKGYSIDYLKLLFKKLGMTIEFETDSWSNLVEKIKRKEIDIIHPLGLNKNREKFLNFTSNHMDLNFSIITKKDNETIKSLDDLEHKTVAVVQGWNSTKFLQKHYPNILFKYYSTAKEKLEAVSFSEVDATVEGLFTTNYLMQKYILSNLKIVGQVQDERLNQKLYMGVRKDWPLLRDMLQKSMNSISQKELKALNIKWIEVPLNQNRFLELSPKEQAYLDKKKKLSLCIDPDWLPYEKNEKGKHIGMTSDYFIHFQGMIPKRIEFISTKDWAQSLYFAKNRTCDILSLAVKTPLKKQYLDFTSAYLKLPLVVATKLDKPFVSSFDDIKNYKLGVVSGYYPIDELRKKYPNAQLIEYSSMKEGFESLNENKIYGFIDSLIAIGYKVQNEYLGSLKIAGKINETFEVGIATRNDEKELNSIFEKAVQQLTDETHKEILNKWVAVKYEKPFDIKNFMEVFIVLFIVMLFFAYRQYLLKRKNSVLQESNKSFEHLINSTIEAMFILEEGKCIDLNDEGVKILGGTSKKDIVGLYAFDVIEKSYHKLVQKNLEQKITVPYEANAVKLDGTIFPVLLKGHSFMLQNKRVRLTAMIDLSDLKSKEKLLLEQTKMAALGEMLGNIAHQWRQPLSVISTAASGMKVQKTYDLLTDELFDEYNSAIMTNVEYLSQTIDDFKNFIKEDKGSHSFVLKEHIEKDLSILMPILKSNSINIITNIDEHFRLTNVENELTQVIINIVSNAKDAFFEKEVDSKYLFINAHKDNNRVVISIQDNAGGIPEEIISKIFEPYFTTKHKSQGTGLGLYMTRKIILESMNGEIEVTNKTFTYKDKEYKGAQFRLSLLLDDSGTTVHQIQN